MKFAHFSHVWSRQGMTAHDRYEQLWRELELADELGFEYGFTVEHHFNPAESLMPCPTLYCAGAAAHTKNLRVGPQGFIPPLYDPIRLVEEVAVLDNLTNGRLEIGLVSGVLPEFFQHIAGADFENRGALTQEIIPLFKAAYGSDGPFSFKSQFHEYKDVTLSVKPLQKPHPPIWRQTRDPDTLTQLAKEGSHTGFIFLYPRAMVAPRYREYLRQWDEAGNPGKPNIGYWTLVYVDEDEETAIAKATEHILHSMQVTFRHGWDNPGANQQALHSMTTARGETQVIEIARNLGSIDYLLNNNLIFVGSPETVTERIRAAAHEGMFNTMMCEFNIGSIPEEDLMRSIRLFGTQVMPALRDLEVY